MATARLTMGAVFGTIASTAATVTGLLDSVNAGAGMLNDYVNSAADEQRKNIKADAAVLEKKIIERISKEQAERRIDINKFCTKSALHLELYQEAYDEFKELFSREE